MCCVMLGFIFIKELIRGGIEIGASLGYGLTPEAYVQCSRSCITIYSSTPNSYVEIFAYYQYRTIRMCTCCWGTKYVSVTIHLFYSFFTLYILSISINTAMWN